MSKYRIADVVVEMNLQYEETLPWYEAYRIEDNTPADFSLAAPDELIDYYVKNGLDFTPATAENRIIGDRFYLKLVSFDGGHIHSSAVLLDDKVYLFSASSGVGKSTLTRRILKYRPEAIIINDDKPAFRVVDRKCYVYGTPFAGGTSVNANESAELGGIFFIERGEIAELSKADSMFAITNLLSQTTRSNQENLSARLLELLGTIIEEYPIYSFKCPNDDTAVIPILNVIDSK